MDFTESSPPAVEVDPVADLAGVDFQPDLSASQVFAYEAESVKVWSAKRRLALYTLTATRDQMVSGFGAPGAAEKLVETIEFVQEWAQHCQDNAALAESAAARLHVVGAILVERWRQESAAQD